MSEDTLVTATTCIALQTTKNKVVSALLAHRGHEQVRQESHAVGQIPAQLDVLEGAAARPRELIFTINRTQERLWSAYAHTHTTRGAKR